MPRSMTGFGRSELVREDWTICWEIKSVNSRFLDLKWRAPMYLRSLENKWEKVVRKHASRGRVDCFLSVQINRPDVLNLSLNKPLASAMLAQMRELAEFEGLDYTPDLNRLLGMSHLWQDAMSEPDKDLAADVEQALVQALESWNRSRSLEGEEMVADLRTRLALLDSLRKDIAARVPLVLEAKIETLQGRIRTMLEAVEAEYNEDRMLQETAVLTDRLDVSEELTRLETHLGRLVEVLDKNGEAGKRLDFLLQETFREINTCGNKGQDGDVSRLVVEFKAELERCREQVQNIE